jgi:hypothetical protein
MLCASLEKEGVKDTTKRISIIKLPSLTWLVHSPPHIISQGFLKKKKASPCFSEDSLALY